MQESRFCVFGSLKSTIWHLGLVPMFVRACLVVLSQAETERLRSLHDQAVARAGQMKPQ